MFRRPFVMVLSGPSGAGKSTLVRLLLERHRTLHFSVSATTRPRRRGEQDGREYHFLAEEAFRRRVAAGEFLEHAEVHGAWYGTLATEVDRQLEAGHSVLLDVDVQGGLHVKERREDAVLVFLLPPSMQELEKRLRARKTDDEATIQRRLARAPDEIAAMTRYDFVVVNDDIERTLGDLDAIFRSESLRRTRLADDHGGDDIVNDYLKETARPLEP